MEKSIKERNEYIDLLKGILILIVVIRHIFQVAASNSDTDYLCNLLTAIEMPLFMLISGYFSIPIIKSAKEDKYDLLKKIHKITIRYLIPFFSYYVIFKMFFMNCFSYNAIANLVNNITLSLWYLFVIWILNICSILALGIVRKLLGKLKKIILFCFIYFFEILIISIIGTKYGFEFIGCKYIIYYSVYYLLGYVLHCYEEPIKNIFFKFNSIIVFICTMIYFIGCWYFKILLLPDNLTYIICRIILASSGAIVISQCAYSLYNLKNSISMKLTSIGTLTLEIYYVHSFLMNVLHVEKADELLSYQGICNIGVLTLFIVLMTASIIFIINQNKYIKLICFGKK